MESSEEAIVIGQGNVALDVARILLSPVERLKSTDICETATDALVKSKVRRVRVVGRRGPLQAPYTIKEVRELMQLPGVAFTPVVDGLLPDNIKKLPRQLSRISQVLLKGSPVEREKAAREWQLLFMRSPVAFEESASNPGTLSGVKFDEMVFTSDPSSVSMDDLNGLRGMRVRSAPGGREEVLNAGLAFRSVGYQSEAIEGMADLGIPFDQKMGIIPNDLWGRVMSPDLGPGPISAGHVPGMYCAGWVKRGPTGVIASTMDDAFTSADVVARDWADNVPFIEGDGPKSGWEAVKKEAQKRNIRSVSWKDWEIIDAEEKRRGSIIGKERSKCTSVQEMLKILDG